MRIQLGAGDQALPGFVNVDIRPVPGVDVVGHAGDLGRFADGSVELIFGHAFFEHLFVPHHLRVLREWKRVLAPDGRLLIIGIPDFAAIARLYVSGAAGIVGPRFDLYNVYRYSHGAPEIGCVGDTWKAWRPDENRDGAPAGWLPQLHKGLFDVGYLYELTEACGLEANVFSYRFPGEAHVLTLGLVARDPTRRPIQPSSAANDIVTATLGAVPTIDRFLEPGTLALCPRPPTTDLMVQFVRQIDQG